MVYLGFIGQLGVLCHGLSEVVSDSGSALSWSIWALFDSWECFIMVYLRLYLTVGVLCHFVMVYLRLHLTVGVPCHGLSEAVSGSRIALSWSIWGFI